MNKINKISKLVAKSMNNLAIRVMEVFEKNYDDIAKGSQPSDLLDIFIDTDLSEGIKKADQIPLQLEK